MEAVGKISAKYIRHMGDDLMVVNAARVSFDKESTSISDRDQKLISYLARHDHWTPFAHPHICIRISAPIFLARQLFKHKVGMVENEVSRRYVDFKPVLYFPESWRKRADNKKQGSSDETIAFNDGLDHQLYSTLNDVLNLYDKLLDEGVCPEQARMVLPQSMMTEWYWTGSLSSWARVYKLRSSPDSQKEHQLLMDQIDDIIRPLFPVSWSELVKKDLNENI